MLQSLFMHAVERKLGKKNMINVLIHCKNKTKKQQQQQQQQQKQNKTKKQIFFA